MTAPAGDEIDATRDTDPCALVACRAVPVGDIVVVGWCCWDAPLKQTVACSIAHCARAGSTVMCHRCGREYGVFVNWTAPNGVVVVTTG